MMREVADTVGELGFTPVFRIPKTVIFLKTDHISGILFDIPSYQFLYLIPVLTRIPIYIGINGIRCCYTVTFETLRRGGGTIRGGYKGGGGSSCDPLQ